MITNARVCRPLLMGFVLAAGIGAAEKRRIEIADLHRIVRVSDPGIAPNGRSIVCVVSRANVTDSRWESELVSRSTSGPAPCARSRTGAGASSSPRWSPSGDRLAFLAAGRARARASTGRSS